ncbi:MAG: protein TolR [Pseudomonadota bacterium]|nr:protein TolR [Pseudomonadota bacterium]MED5339003.1 protein TolR [Pseudomonadota bacterium]MEE3206777.1 protein TolR [Pseudomonadota bacterium]MEE3260370.1 protein TolR [Pseudomonadota bacterium]|tara:strand:+ start:1155 stop:1601 length:447 start_codon:yes stop_codon:yes gene_type:complete
MAFGSIDTQLKSRGIHKKPPMSDINVTPMVDVMLVLLVIFMVTAPLLTVGVPVELPKTEAREITQQTEPLVISIDALGKVFIQDTEVGMGQLIPRLKAISKAKQNNKIFVRGDTSISYGKVLELMALITSSGFDQVALVSDRRISRRK